EAHIVGAADLTDLREVLVEEAVAVMGEAPLGHDRATARDDTGDPVDGERYVRTPYAGVNGEIVYALLRLLDQGVAVDLPGELLGDATDFLECLIDRHGADRHRSVAQDPFANGVDVAPGGQVHHRVRTPADGPHELVDLLRGRRGDRGVTDVGVDLHQEVAADDHRHPITVICVGGNGGGAAPHFARPPP